MGLERVGAAEVGRPPPCCKLLSTSSGSSVVGFPDGDEGVPRVKSCVIITYSGLFFVRFEGNSFLSKRLKLDFPLLKLGILRKFDSRKILFKHYGFMPFL